MSIPDQQPRKRPLPLRITRGFFYWLWWLYVYICVTIVTGSLIGIVLFASIGALSHPDMDLLRRVEMGLTDGFYYSGMWSGGLAIVLCFVRAHRLNAQRNAVTGAGKSGVPVSFEIAGRADADPASR